MSYRDLKDYGYTDEEIYGDPDYDPSNEFAGRLCCQCGNAMGPYWSDTCVAYNMPLSMVSRKAKCKRFKEIKWEE